MLTINLEKELVKNKLAELNQQEELILAEANKILEKNTEDDIKTLERLGLDKLIKDSKQITYKVNKQYGELEKERIFSKDDIKQLCKTYCLKFLPVQYYKGRLDPYLPTKIKEAENKYRTLSKYDLHIVAPSQSFTLTEKDRDPLLFAKVDDDRYYLIHKWGNDLSIFNMLKGFVFRNYYTVFLTVLLSFSLPIFIIAHNVCDAHTTFTNFMTLILCIIGIVPLVLLLTGDDIKFLEKRVHNNWNKNEF